MALVPAHLSLRKDVCQSYYEKQLTILNKYCVRKSSHEKRFFVDKAERSKLIYGCRIDGVYFRYIAVYLDQVVSKERLI